MDYTNEDDKRVNREIYRTARTEANPEVTTANMTTFKRLSVELWEKRR